MLYRPLLLIVLLLAPLSAAFAQDADQSATAQMPAWRVEAADMMSRFEAIRDNTGEQSAAQRLQEFIDLGYDYQMLIAPEYATYLGDPRFQDRWSDQSAEWLAQDEQNTRIHLAVIDAIPRDELNAAEQLNYDLLRDRLSREVDGFAFPEDYLAISQLYGPQQDIAQIIALMSAGDTEDYRNILSRLETVPVVVDQTIALLEQGLEAGVTPPRVTLRDVPQQIRNQIFDNPAESPLLAPFQNMPAGVPDELGEQAATVYGEAIRPAFQRLLDFMENRYLPGARETIAMGDMPEGRAWYAHRVNGYTTLELSPQEIHDIGQEEVRRIRAEMEAVRADSGFDGDLPAFFEFLRTDPQFYYTEREDLLIGYRDISKRADPQLVKLFGKLPRLPYGVVAVPEYAEKSQTTAYYQGGSLEAGRPGQFFANTYALDTRPKWEMEALTLHEGVPGHHFQIALAQEQEGLPWFRKFGGYTAFVEGWGLYAESLGEEMGFYQDPYSKFGQLTYEMWRAIRLVVDTGMHELGWSREQAIDFFKQNAGKQEHDIIVEIDRYIVWPGQALAYKLGELKLKELRAYATETLGADFDIRAFHDQILASGALPLNILDARTRAWVAAQQHEQDSDQG